MGGGCGAWHRGESSTCDELNYTHFLKDLLQAYLVLLRFTLLGKTDHQQKD